MQSHTRRKRSGKIERSFRTVKDNFINCTDWNTFSSLEDLNIKYNNYLNEEYNNKHHSAIDTTPRIKFNAHYERLKFTPSHDAVDEMFLHTLNRKVANDATISLNSKLFEVPQKYIKQKINVKFSPSDLTVAYIYDEHNKRINSVYPVNKIDNSKIKRNSIDYSNLMKEDDVNV